MLDEVLAWGLKSAMVSWHGQPETDQKPSVGLALCAENPPHVRPGKYSMDASAKLDIPDDGLAQAIRLCEAL
jgi:hypothetical protein